MPRHKTVKLKYKGKEKDIDIKIAPLIKEIWKAHIATRQCCQDKPKGHIWVQFPSTKDLKMFLDIGTADTDEIFRDSTQQVYSIDAPVCSGWWYGLTVIDDAIALEYDDYGNFVYEGPPNFTIGVSCYFPHSDLPEVLERFKAYNK